MIKKKKKKKKKKKSEKREGHMITRSQTKKRQESPLPEDGKDPNVYNGEAEVDEVCIQLFLRGLLFCFESLVVVFLTLYMMKTRDYQGFAISLVFAFVAFSIIFLLEWRLFKKEKGVSN